MSFTKRPHNRIIPTDFKRWRSKKGTFDSRNESNTQSGRPSKSMIKEKEIFNLGTEVYDYIYNRAIGKVRTISFVEKNRLSREIFVDKATREFWATWEG